MRPRDLHLDLDAFEGPFDLLLALILKEELPLAEVEIARIVVAYVERLVEVERLDLEACGEFLLLVAGLLELKARELFPQVDADLVDLEPAEAAEELARRLEEYRRIKAAASWLSERLRQESDRFFRLGPAPLSPRLSRRLAPQDPRALADSLRALAAEPSTLSLAHMGLSFPSIERFLDRFRALLRRRLRFDLETELRGLGRLEQAAAFLALLELRKREEARLEQAYPFAPIRVLRPAVERSEEWKTATSA
ncbi:MAG: chromosome segregation protein ScpA [Thermoleophilia bacterium]